MKREAFVRELPDADVPTLNDLRNSCCFDMTLPVELYAGADIIAKGAVTLPQTTTLMYGIAVLLFVRALEKRGIRPQWDGFRVDTMPSVRPALEYTQGGDGLRDSLQEFPNMALKEGWEVTQGLLSRVPDVERTPPELMKIIVTPVMVGLINQYARVGILSAPTMQGTLIQRMTQKLHAAKARIPRIF